MRSLALAAPIAASLILSAIFWGQNVPVLPYVLTFFDFSFFALPIAASQILSASNIKKKPRRKYNVPRPSHRNAAGVINEKTPRIVPVWQKIRQSIPQLI
jgi:hypothetical protein